MDRRHFIAATLKSSAIMAALPLEIVRPGFTDTTFQIPTGKPEPSHEIFWGEVRKMFDITDTFIQLENGYFSPQPRQTMLYHQEKERYIKTNSSWFMRKEQDLAWEDSRAALAALCGVSADEVALMRNTTEALNTVISGYPWKKGDEVIIGDQDYGSMVSAFRQAEKRHGIRVKVARIPLYPSDDWDIIHAYRQVISKRGKTRMVLLTHLINLTGQVLPVSKIALELKKWDVEIMVDAAHSFAQIDFQIPDLHADYVAASLHKWLCCPLGTGFLWMKKEHIPKIWPLMADTDLPGDQIRKFEHQGPARFSHGKQLPRPMNSTSPLVLWTKRRD